MKNLEKKETLWKLLEDSKGELLDLCAQLIRRPSINPPINAEEITDFITKYFKENNIEHEVIFNHPRMPIILAKVGTGKGEADSGNGEADSEKGEADSGKGEADSEKGEAGSGNGTVDSKNGKVLCINGHTDIVPPGDLSKWEFDPHCGTITDTQVQGRGASDMLCGVAIAMHLAKLITKHQIELLGEVRLHLVSDEESGGEYGSKFLTENGYADDIDAVMLPEPTTYNNVETGSKGSVRAVIRCRGTQVHGSVSSFAGGDNAMKKMVKILSRVEDLRSMEAHYEEHQLPVIKHSKNVAEAILKVKGVGEAIDHVTCNVSYLKAGTEDLSPAEYCEASVAYGVPNGIRAMDVKNAFLELLKEFNIPDADVEITRERDATYTPASEEIVQTALENANAVWGENKKVVPVYQWATSDGRYYRLAGIPSIQYGPANIDGVHGYSECAEIEEIVNCAKAYLGVITDFVGVNI